MNEYVQLLHDYFDGDLTPEGAAKLREYIKQNPAQADEILHHAFLHSNLHELLTGISQVEDHLSLGDAQILPALQEDDTPLQQEGLLPETWRSPPPPALPPAHEKQLRKPIQARRILPWAAMAGLLITLGIILMIPHPPHPPLPVATLAESIDAQWDNPAVPMHEGQQLLPGPLRLTRGIAQLSFPNGASIILQGPAVAELLSSSKIRMTSGRITTNIPAPAAGFTVLTPAAAVIDLGTEFGINVQPNQDAHVEVFKGRAAVQLPDAAATDQRVLTPDTAVNISATLHTIENAPTQPLAFVRHDLLQSQLAAPADPYTRWLSFSNQLRQDPHLITYFPFQPDLDPTRLNNAAFGQAAPPADITSGIWADGRFAQKQSLLFKASDSGAKLYVPGSFKQLTLTAWVNALSFDHPFASIFMCDSTSQQDIFHWQFNKRAGQIALELGISQSKDEAWQNYDFPAGVAANPNQWHLLTMTYDLAGTAISCWIDGQFIGSQPLQSSRLLTIGKAVVGNWVPYRPNDYRAFHGCIDELAIWDRILSPDEIRAMYNAGAPAANAN